MNTRLTSAVWLFVAAGAATTAAPGQTGRPGEMTRAEVWVKNPASESIPVTVQDVRVDKPIRVIVMNGEPALPPLQVRMARTSWEYQTVRVTPDEATAKLSGLGNQGWETTGVAWPSDGGTVLLMKRAR